MAQCMFVCVVVEHGGNSNDATCAIVRVLCIPSHAKHYWSSEYMVDGRKYDTSDFAVI